MTIELFTMHLQRFCDSHGIGTNLHDRLRKLCREVDELGEAISTKDHVEIGKEAADVAIIAVHIMMIVGIANPLFAMYTKLQEVAARPKYRELRNNARIKDGVHLHGCKCLECTGINSTCPECGRKYWCDVDRPEMEECPFCMWTPTAEPLVFSMWEGQEGDREGK